MHSVDEERRLQKAELLMEVEGKKTNKSDQVSNRAIALANGVAPSTLDTCLNRWKSKAQFAEERRLLGKQEEIVLANYIQESAERAFPLTCTLIRNCVINLVQSRSPGTGVGQKWVYRWMLRHPELRVYTSSPLDQVRIDGMNPHVMDLYWKALRKVFYELWPEDDPVDAPFISAMDETGMMLGIGGKQKVVGTSGKNIQHLGCEGNRKLVTVMVTICADGTKLKEWIIFKGKKFQERWTERNLNNLRSACIRIQEGIITLLAILTESKHSRCTVRAHV